MQGSRVMADVLYNLVILLFVCDYVPLKLKTAHANQFACVPVCASAKKKSSKIFEVTVFLNGNLTLSKVSYDGYGAKINRLKSY